MHSEWPKWACYRAKFSVTVTQIRYNYHGASSAHERVLAPLPIASRAYRLRPLSRLKAYQRARCGKPRLRPPIRCRGRVPAARRRQVAVKGLPAAPRVDLVGRVEAGECRFNDRASGGSRQGNGGLHDQKMRRGQDVWGQTPPPWQGRRSLPLHPSLFPRYYKVHAQGPTCSSCTIMAKLYYGQKFRNVHKARSENSKEHTIYKGKGVDDA